MVVLSGFEPESPAPKASMIDHYTTGLLGVGRTAIIMFYRFLQNASGQLSDKICGSAFRDGDVPRRSQGDVVLDHDRKRRERRVLIDVVTRQRLEFAMKNGGEFARESVMPPKVGTVREALVVDFNENVGLGDEIGELGAGRSRGGTFEKNLVPVAHAEFRRAAKDSFALVAVDLRRFDFLIAKRDSRRGEGRLESDARVRGAADRLTDAVAAIDLAERSRLALGRLERFGGNDFADDDAVDKTRNRRDSFNLGGRHRETVGDELRVKVGDIDEVGDPIQRDKHGRL